MKKKLILYGVVLSCIMVGSITLPELARLGRDYSTYLTFIQSTPNSMTIKDYESIYIRLTIEDGIPKNTVLDWKLTENESAHVYDILSQIEDTQLIHEPKDKDETHFMRMHGFHGDFFILYPNYFLSGQTIYATSANYPDIYSEVMQYLLTLDISTHKPNRPI